ncbi:putative nuclease HARBI1 [Diabrotica virgifera virgifera]|uniref:DDE Tnp4 domain-containing protein n=1 Tax=Diabrotica virgifera virgifera TaxID=50390 RepID=A0ABM5L781_DIAVI|nr:putative nuclease HARBI1 [Diabrotica virgifera virgifera]
MEFQNIVEEEMYENILLNLINDDDVPVPNVIPPNLLEIVREENGDRRRVIPRNEDFYEEVIPRYFEDLFVEHFRMSRAVFQQLLELVGNQGMVSENALIPLEKKLLFTVWMLAKPECFLAAGDRFGLSKGTGHFIFKEIVAILKHLRFQLILWPNNHENSMRVFNERSNGFSGVVGAIDGCHIPIKQPANNGHDYYNRKQFHSIILQGVCDHQMLFLDINVGMPGRVHDARVFRNSQLFQRLTSQDAPLLTNNQHILGDSAYPLLVNLMTPFRDNGHLNVDQNRYNEKLSCIRSIIERAFGLLKNKFRRLKFLEVASPTFASDIVAAACVLHNFIILHKEEVNVQEDDEENIVFDNVENERIEEENEAVLKRNHFVNIFRNN